jgi:predicted nucleic acid-binding protein
MANKIDIRKHAFKGDEKLFLDTNIWFYIFGPAPKNPKPDYRIMRKWYSDAYKTIQEKNCSIYTDALIISEFVNAFAREMLKRYNYGIAKQIDYKEYRKTSDFKNKVGTITSETKKIFKSSAKCNSDFESMDFDLFFLEFEKCNLDLNDIIYNDICKTKGFTLVTNDKDFKSCDIPIMTANNELLGAS